MSEQSQQQGFRAFLRVLRKRTFFWLWLSQLISLVGDFFSYLAVPYLITVLATGDATAAGDLPAEAKTLVGMTTLAFTAPRLLGIFTGVFVDRWDRKRTMVLANITAALIMLLPLLVDSLEAVWLLIVSQFALAVVTRFIQPTQQAILPQILDQEDLLAANGLMSLNMTLGIIVGPMIAGVTVAAFGVKAAFVVDSLTFLAAAAIVRWRVDVPALANAPTDSGTRAILGNIWEGVRFILVTPLLLATVISFSLMQGGIGGINAMWVPSLRETFGLGPIGITAVDTAQGIGMALGALALGLMMARVGLLGIAAGGLAGVGLTLVGMGAAPSFGFLIVMSVLLGILLVPSQSAFSTLMQLAIPIELQGRVFSSFGAITQAASVMMIALVTALVASIPLRPIFVGGGAAVVASAGLWVALVRGDVRRLEQGKREPAVLQVAGHSVTYSAD